jgi:hypothetical protein
MINGEGLELTASTAKGLAPLVFVSVVTRGPGPGSVSARGRH